MMGSIPGAGARAHPGFVVHAFSERKQVARDWPGEPELYRRADGVTLRELGPVVERMPRAMGVRQ